jgi:sulfate adenylyltransferase subunit 1 (EFTu-like GTPase family)
MRRCCPDRPYLIKVGTKTVTGSITEIKHKVDVNTLEHLAAKAAPQRDRHLQYLAVRADRLRPYRDEPRDRFASSSSTG